MHLKVRVALGGVVYARTGAARAMYRAYGFAVERDEERWMRVAEEGQEYWTVTMETLRRRIQEHGVRLPEGMRWERATECRKGDAGEWYEHAMFDAMQCEHAGEYAGWAGRRDWRLGLVPGRAQRRCAYVIVQAREREEGVAEGAVPEGSGSGEDEDELDGRSGREWRRWQAAEGRDVWGWRAEQTGRRGDGDGGGGDGEVGGDGGVAGGEESAGVAAAEQPQGRRGTARRVGGGTGAEARVAAQARGGRWWLRGGDGEGGEDEGGGDGGAADDEEEREEEAGAALQWWRGRRDGGEAVVEVVATRTRTRERQSDGGGGDGDGDGDGDGGVDTGCEGAGNVAAELGDDGDNLATRVRRRLARTRDGVHPQGACWERRLCEATAEWAVGAREKVQWGLSMRGLRVRLMTAYAAAWRNGRRREGVRARWRAAAGHAMAVVAARARWRRVREWVKEQGALRRAREKAGTATRNVGEVRGTGRGVMGGYSETRQYARRAEKATPVTERRRMRPRPTTVGGVVQ